MWMYASDKSVHAVLVLDSETLNRGPGVSAPLDKPDPRTVRRTRVTLQLVSSSAASRTRSRSAGKFSPKQAMAAHPGGSGMIDPPAVTSAYCLPPVTQSVLEMLVSLSGLARMVVARGFVIAGTHTPIQEAN